MDHIDAAEFALSLPEIDPAHPSPARIYDFWLGGSQNFAADRALGRRMAESYPGLPVVARANRAFLGRVVRHLAAECGVTQFLDLGSGVPTMGNVHEVAREANPGARVVYVDVDPVAVEHARLILAGTEGVAAMLADLRRPETVFGHPLLTDTLDLDRPVAVLMFALLHFFEEGREIVEAYTEPLAPGSFLALSQAQTQASTVAEQASATRDYVRSTGVAVVSRDPGQIAELVEGLDIEPPGVVPVDEWRAEPLVDTPPGVRMLGVLARKLDPRAR
ncbi:MAG TPA: SAM-dependent methyltransferase [Actinospica sp.]|jgi:hypothetical protein|nr:SAM-dependent methyltransferase [Actinospica sp.]